MPHATQFIEGLDPGKFESKEYVLRDVPNGLPKVPFLAGVFGSRGAGKTTAMINLIRAYQRSENLTPPAWDHIIIFSPTAKKDPKYKALEDQLSNKDTKVELVEDFTITKMSDYIKYMETEIESFNRKDTALEAYAKFKEKHFSIDKLNEDELLALYSYDFNPEGKVAKMYKHGKPSFCMVFDDLVGEKLVYSSTGTNIVCKFALRHRHYNCTMIFLAQTWANGVPRQIRHNLSLAVFFRVNSRRLKEEVAEEMSSFISEDEFIELWDEATQEHHDYFMVDFSAPPEFKFRKNLDTIFQGVNSAQQLLIAPPPLPSTDPPSSTPQDDPRPRVVRSRKHDKICKIGPGSVSTREILRGL